MFNFGKKKLDDRSRTEILISIGLFQSWTIDKRGEDLDSGTLDYIIKNILEHKNIKYSDDDVYVLRIMALANTDWDTLRGLRIRSDFDANVARFCATAKLPAKYYTPDEREPAEVVSKPVYREERSNGNNAKQKKPTIKGTKGQGADGAKRISSVKAPVNPIEDRAISSAAPRPSYLCLKCSYRRNYDPLLRCAMCNELGPYQLYEG